MKSCIGKLDKTSEMDREWQRRHDQFHTIGYRDGLMAGKETSAQEGFNIGFRDSVYVGYNWGLVRGITSAFASLPDDLIERMVDTKEIQYKFQHLHESVQSLSTTEVLRCSMIICQRNRKKVVKMINPAPAWPMPMTSAPMTIFWTITRKSYNQLLMNQGSNCT